MDTPVLLIFFNRQIVFNVIDVLRKNKIRKLYIASDGGRYREENEMIQKLRDAVKVAVDWECEVYYRFSEENQGCEWGPVNAINWVFENEEECIILEDDCVPESSFFEYCAELLEYYKEDERIWMVSGENYLADKSLFGDCDYTFSLRTDTWGWATWKRAWIKCDFHLKKWLTYKREEVLKKSNYMRYYHEIDFLTEQLDNIYKGRDETVWDYQWRFHMLINGGLCIIPKHNLVDNIGWGGEATHTTGNKISIFDVGVQTMKFPLKHPSCVIANSLFDEKYGNLLRPQNPIKDFVKKIWRR